MNIYKKIKSALKLMRIDKPIGIFLLLWPTLISLFIAGSGHPPPDILAIFVLGVLIMRAAGCVMNDLADYRFDRFVSRTKERPLILGKISKKEALFIFSILILIAFLLVIRLNFFTIFLSIIAFFFTLAYPFMKRYTNFPQVFLGATFGMSIPMAFTAIQNYLPMEAFLFYFANLFWIVAYDTQYALADRIDDIQIGVKSTAVYFEDKSKFFILICQVIFTSLLIFLGYILSFNFYYFAGILIAIFFMLYQQILIQSLEPNKCFRAFLNNHYIGLILFFGLLLNYRMR